MFHVRSILINTYLAGFDLAITAGCYLLLLYWRLGLQDNDGGWERALTSERILALGWVLGIWLVLLWHFGMYHSRRTAGVFVDLGVIAKVSAAGLVILSALAHFVPGLRPAPLFLVRLAGVVLVVMSVARVGVRLVLRELRRRGHNIKNLLLVTGTESGERLRQKIAGRAQFGYRIVRHLELSPNNLAGAERLFAEFERVLRDTHVDDIILALPAGAHALTARLAEACEARGINVRLVPDLFPLIQSDTQVYDLDGIPLVNVRVYPTEIFGYLILKRAFDIGASLVVMAVSSPLWLLIALLVKLTSHGPMFFVQERIGLNGRRFKMLKFRTMQADSGLDPETHWTTRNEPHITPLGRWLRRSNLDELPQFLNVLRGDMSIVGPRPERPHFIERFRQEVPNYMLRHYVKCGITGWAQVNGWRGDSSIRERVAHDLYYMGHWGLMLDLKILFWTATRTFFHPNAY